MSVFTNLALIISLLFSLNIPAKSTAMTEETAKANADIYVIGKIISIDEADYGQFINYMVEITSVIKGNGVYKKSIVVLEREFRTVCDDKGCFSDMPYKIGDTKKLYMDYSLSPICVRDPCPALPPTQAIESDDRIVEVINDNVPDFFNVRLVTILAVTVITVGMVFIALIIKNKKRNYKS